MYLFVCIIVGILGFAIGFSCGLGNKDNVKNEKPDGYIIIHEKEDDGTKIESWEFSIDTVNIDTIKNKKSALFKVDFAK